MLIPILRDSFSQLSQYAWQNNVTISHRILFQFFNLIKIIDFFHDSKILFEIKPTCAYALHVFCNCYISTCFDITLEYLSTAACRVSFEAETRKYIYRTDRYSELRIALTSCETCLENAGGQRERREVTRGETRTDYKNTN